MNRDKVCEFLFNCCVYSISDSDVDEIIKAFSDTGIEVTAQNLKTVAEIKNRHKNFQWGQLKRVLEVSKKYATVQTMKVTKLKKLLREEHVSSAKCSYLIRQFGLADKETVDGETAKQVLGRSALFPSKEYQPRQKKQQPVSYTIKINH